MWDLPRPGLEPVSPALASRFSTTAPPGKPFIEFYREYLWHASKFSLGKPQINQSKSEGTMWQRAAHNGPQRITHMETQRNSDKSWTQTMQEHNQHSVERHLLVLKSFQHHCFPHEDNASRLCDPCIHLLSIVNISFLFILRHMQFHTSFWASQTRTTVVIVWKFPVAYGM